MTGLPHDAWLHTPHDTFEALVLLQRGEFRAALQQAESSRQLALLHSSSPTFSGDLDGFTIFLTHWARGASQLARETMHEFAEPERADLAVVHSVSGLTDLAGTLLCLQEGRWSDAAETASRLVKMLTLNDPFGLMPLGQAALALALAALGDDDNAWEALRRSGRLIPGLSLAMRGILECLRLRARHWLRDPDIVQHAREVIVWALSQRLPLIELEAIYVLTHEIKRGDQEFLERAVGLAASIDPPIGDAILACIRSLTTGANETEDKFHWRVLAELGLWLPLPPVAQLTGREREIALATALGYPSKHIAARLHLSSRTVETHLTHIYEKLDVNGREELRSWFARRRELI